MRRWQLLGWGVIGLTACSGNRPTFGNDSSSGQIESEDRDANDADAGSTSASTSDSSIASETNDRTTVSDDALDASSVDVSSTQDSASNDNDGSRQVTSECADQEVEDCNECGQRACNSATGKWGACLPAEEARCNEAGTAIEVCNESGNWDVETCINPDPDNCIVRCETPEDVATCVFDAKDADGDGYLSAKCEAAAGDDCDDSTQLVSPGSSEICDNQDNDCDGYIDILDSSLKLAGSPTLVGRSGVSDLRRIDITWQGSEFAVVADGKPTNDTVYTAIYAGYARTNGTAAFDTVVHSSADLIFDSPRIAFAEDTLGITSRFTGRDGGAYFTTLSSNRVVSTTERLEGFFGDVATNGSLYSLVTHLNSSPNTVFFTQANPTGTMQTPILRDDIPGDISIANAALAGDVTGVVYTDTAGSQPRVLLLRLSSAGTILGPTELAQPAQNGDITPLASGNFALAWATPGGLKLQVRETNGNTVVCDSDEVTFGDNVLQPLDSVAVGQTSLGIVVVAADSGSTTGQAGIFIFDDNCTPRAQTHKALFDSDLSTHQAELPHLPRVAVGGGNIAVAWTVAKGTTYATYVRTMPESMCD